VKLVWFEAQEGVIFIRSRHSKIQQPSAWGDLFVSATENKLHREQTCSATCCLWFICGGSEGKAECW